VAVTRKSVAGTASELVSTAGAALDGDQVARTLDVSGGKAAGFYDLIRADVMSGRLAPGQRLSEASLSRQYNVSRSPVREALAQLDRDGLLERRGSVVYVRERTAGEVLDIYQVRIYLEGAIAADAAQRRHPLDLRRLEWALEIGDAVTSSDPMGLMEANRTFHKLLVDAAHNATLADLQNRLTAQVAVLPATTLAVDGRWDEARAEHRAIVTAVEAGDAAAARAAAELHITKARDIRLKLYESDFSG
jgi:DNA-binding GntR family transcriptional regulator